MKELTSLLEQLAAKLGTTVEYLWSVLIRQAYVSATTDLIMTIIIIISGIILYKFHKHFSNTRDKYDRSIYERSDGGIVITMGIFTFVWIIFLFIAIFVAVPNIITGYINPEYWALEHVLDTLKSSK